ncbi:hypothetical protein E1B28_003137 [Marasmius oreades]|uniref:Dynactin subunit 2 n=1 Tax=Marasmius oreades TaxID=181124 RepID=A0A9P7RL23_9AGAR|nr:uncharacterized protein E1B28_003137 [Marasmius oreades]KAG7085584.1 hypothetical protein E1B28_003137 [Marasmius oreades]
MSVHKYANLPDIDTAPDVYETEDVAPSSQTNKDSSDDEGPIPTRSVTRGKTTETSREELDSSNLMNAEEASKKFRRAEKRRERVRTHYIYPPSPISSDDEDGASRRKHVSLSHRLKTLQAEMQSLEAELADPSNPLLQDEKEEGQVDPGELIRGLVDVRRRLEKVRKEKEGRGKLMGVVLGQQQRSKDTSEQTENETPHETESSTKEEMPGTRILADMDSRVAMLEKLIGSSATPLEETSPLPPPLLPQISRLSAQLGVLTQPRHIDSISRRLKLLLSELERTSQHRRHGSQSNVTATSLQEQILPLLNRLGPSLPQIPHILMRLKTLSALHTSASEFENTLNGLEEEQQKMRGSITDLESAVARLESNLEENRQVVTGNVTGLEERVGALMERTK